MYTALIIYQKFFLKNLFKNIIFKLYQAAYREARHRKLMADRAEKQKAALFDASVSLDKGIIKNYREIRDAITIGINCVVEGELMLFRHGGNISIGSDCYIGPGTRIWSAKQITIGNRVLISYGVSIHDNISHPMDPVLRHEDFKHIFFKGGFQENIDLKEESVSIGDDAWIGFNTIILKGVAIGKGAVIGAGSVITEDVPDNAVVVGNPQRIVRYNN